MHQSLTVFFSGSQFYDAPLHNPTYLSSYRIFAEEVRKLGARFAFVRGQQTYIGGNRFAGGWKFINGMFVYESDVIDADIIYNKGEVFSYDSSAFVINQFEFDAITRNKLRTYEWMPELFPGTQLVKSSESLQAVLKEMPFDRIVIKPLRGWGGSGVWIGSKSDALLHVPAYPCIVQEFLDTSDGIPGLTNGLHDFRLILFDDRPVMALLRVPKRGSMLANVAQGGSIRSIQLDSIPREVLELKERVTEHTQRFGKRVYSMDCARTIDGSWKLIELNPQPGLPSLGKEEERRAYLRQLSAFLLNT